MEETVTVSFSSQPLFSCFITLYTLILIYFPHVLIQFSLSPLLLISGSLLVALFIIGSAPESNTPPVKSVNIREDEEFKVLVRELDSDTKPGLIKEDFVEWNLKAPLEVIHEAYEDDEEEENPSVSGEKDPTQLRELERFPSLSLCYPESDSDSASSSEFNFTEIGNWNSPEIMGMRWEEEEEGVGGEGLIEIKLDEYNRSHERKTSEQNQTELDFSAEEEGLIEIDLFP